MAGLVALHIDAVLGKSCMIHRVVDESDLGAVVIPAVGKECPHAERGGHCGAQSLGCCAALGLDVPAVLAFLVAVHHVGQILAVELDVEIGEDDSVECGIEEGVIAVACGVISGTDFLFDLSGDEKRTGETAVVSGAGEALVLDDFGTESGLIDLEGSGFQEFLGYAGVVGDLLYDLFALFADESFALVQCQQVVVISESFGFLDELLNALI